MECGCNDEYCDLESGPECMTTVWRKARKEHRCCECYRTIEKGEKYQYISGIWDGAPSSFKTCRQCAQIRDDYGCCAYFGDLREYIWDSLGVDIVDGRVFVNVFEKED